jgi:hypothetical protein
MTGWEAFGTVMGGATGALLGLLFAAVSIRAEPIARSDELRSRSAETMALLSTGLLPSALLTVPGQAKWELGAEFLGPGLVTTGVGIVLDRRAGSGTGNAFAQVLDAANPTSVTCALLFAVGVVLALGHRWGLYLLVPALFAVFVGGVINAWLILVRLGV